MILPQDPIFLPTHATDSRRTLAAGFGASFDGRKSGVDGRSMAIHAAAFVEYRLTRRAPAAQRPSAPIAATVARELTAHARTILCDEELVSRRMGALLCNLKRRTVLARLGFARFDSYMMERLGQSARWGERLIELHRTLSVWPILDRAFSAGVLPTTKALAIARVVTEATVVAWVKFASASSFKHMSEAVRRAVPGDLPPESEKAVEPDGSAGSSARRHDAEDVSLFARGAWTQVRAPAPVAHLYDHTLEIVRRVVGEQLGATACLAHVFAEFAASNTVRGSQIERTLDWQASHAKETGSEPSPECLARGRPQSPIAEPDGPDPFASDAALRQLARNRQRRHGALAEVLTTMHKSGGWLTLGYHDFDGYCRSELGISGRFARQLVYAHRQFQALPLLGAAYLEGSLSWTKARLLISVCRPGTQQAWLERAARVTARYLEEEVSTCVRLFEEEPEKASVGPLPLTHVPPGSGASPLRPGSGLFRGNEKDAGEQGQNPHELGLVASTWPAFSLVRMSQAPNLLPCTIRFWLPHDTRELYRAIVRDLETAAGVELEPWESLLLILRHFLQTWDRSERDAFATEHDILNRDGYQCAAPGCRMRRTLEVHHIVFRSRGGNDRSENLVTLCASHHRIALHEQRGLTCVGTALARLHWGVGRTRFHGDVLA